MSMRQLNPNSGRHGTLSAELNPNPENKSRCINKYLAWCECKLNPRLKAQAFGSFAARMTERPSESRDS